MATAQYTPTNFKAHNGRGTGRSEVTPSERVVVPEYEDFWLELHVRDLSGHSSVYSTKDPRTAHHLIVDGHQLPTGSKPQIGKFMPCGRTVAHDWEDGGNFNKQDMFFDVKTTCDTPDSTKVRLVR